MAPLSRSGNAISAGCRRFSLPPSNCAVCKKSSTSRFTLRQKISNKASNVTLLRLSITFTWLLTKLDLGFVPSTAGTNRPRKPQNSTHVLNCKDGPIAGGPSMAAPSCLIIIQLISGSWIICCNHLPAKYQQNRLSPNDTYQNMAESREG